MEMLGGISRELNEQKRHTEIIIIMAHYERSSYHGDHRMEGKGKKKPASSVHLKP